MQEAIDWVKRCPNPHEEDCEIEIRPVFEMDDFGEAMPPNCGLRRNASWKMLGAMLRKREFEFQPVGTILELPGGGRSTLSNANWLR